MSTGGKAPCAVQVSGADDSVMVDEVRAHALTMWSWEFLLKIGGRKVVFLI